VRYLKYAAYAFIGGHIVAIIVCGAIAIIAAGAWEAVWAILLLAAGFIVVNDD
jgi:uncharacterized membrane protein